MTYNLQVKIVIILVLLTVMTLGNVLLSSLIIHKNSQQDELITGTIKNVDKLIELDTEIIDSITHKE